MRVLAPFPTHTSGVHICFGAIALSPLTPPPTHSSMRLSEASSAVRIRGMDWAGAKRPRRGLPASVCSLGVLAKAGRGTERL